MQPFVDRRIPITDPLYNEAFGPILPAHILGQMAPAAIVRSDYARQPWGTGPYRVTAFRVNEFIQLDANPYYNVTPNPPAIRTIYSPLLRDNKQIPLALDLGTLDATTSEGLSPDLLPAIAALTATGKFRLTNLAGYGYEHIDFHTQREPFNDPRLRQALAYAIDRAGINQAVFGNRATFINSYITPNSWASIENPRNIERYPAIASELPRYTYDLAQANRLLDDAGWTARDAAGIRSKNGESLQITWLAPTRSTRKLIAEIAQQSLRAIGIDVVIELVPAGQFLADPPDGPLYSGSYGDYGVAVFGYIPPNDEPVGIYFYDSSQIPSAANGYAGANNLFWNNPESDQLLRDAGTGLGHSPERVQAYLRQQVIFMRDVPSIPLYAIPVMALADGRLQHFQMNAQGILLNMQEWYLPRE
jgi:peptide/nickel transport system substrate-binding protein